MAEFVVLVDASGKPTGLEEKMAAHEKGLLHAAFSVFVFNKKGELLLQQRASGKYHSGGLWTNTCCSHPRDKENVADAAHRRLREEMGFDCPLREEYAFTYEAKLDHGLTEHEFDHVFFGDYDGEIKPNPEEVGGYRWIGLGALEKEVAAHPEKFTAWFKVTLPEMLRHRKRAKH
ncbi:isopentenyl-diphosphate delta-isomerase [Candidatus Micrarchaeota archaeon CG_4_10_14_0_2_um_filter_60_11]|nr:MAG: isopentenyl-diphosphate delta-isomerase [Candidatus Micrarchaeota archaeon CG1_02_60_51]PIN95764.1 MAG: isopentenyl-diphosphate delta-isomerase [Candidatus Micrarchaeota archaeon CG10_big_fil_rev_8_21_14_0_10_60_32]PIO01717.1 MAG: isopentenyl-diphosphate delta-isomerase [Candidatus Micrarchaeota archaeon CG09_land_8_20_14_0_10_60_16]PIY91762.1 MAG: isopentenyl-diphosphate delta-isomerase [Candidatus Micrarchaeota archaeon CG_4_10_14_0_8_um_filter_60_7]PIZ91333.1 MAG: isopentenyl-diphosp